jgi:hypothetical protein
MITPAQIRAISFSVGVYLERHTFDHYEQGQDRLWRFICRRFYKLTLDERSALYLASERFVMCHWDRE